MSRNSIIVIIAAVIIVIVGAIFIAQNVNIKGSVSQPQGVHGWVHGWSQQL